MAAGVDPAGLYKNINDSGMLKIGWDAFGIPAYVSLCFTCLDFLCLNEYIVINLDSEFIF